MTIELNERIALVTGAGRGIGKAIAHSLANSGAHVICVSKSDSCQKVADELTSNGKKASAFQCDVSDPQQVEDTCKQALEQFKNIDILVNNAGITRDTLLVRMSPEDWNDVVNTNLTSMFHWTRNLLRPMTQKRWGRIINVASVVGITGNPGQFNYCAAKAGMIGATKSLAKEVAARNITANVIAPGFIETDMTAVLGEKTTDAILQMVPLKRMGQADDIANAATFLASDLSNYITGHVLTVDGGMTMY